MEKEEEAEEDDKEEEEERKAMKKETLVVVVRCNRYTAFFEQSIPFWNNMSYSTYIGIQY